MKITRRHFLNLSAAWLFAVLLPTVAARAAELPARPNIIFILTDDQGYGDLSCHGNPVLETPNLDRLHGESARFTDFHVSPTCAPTRAALLTGRHEFRSGVTHTISERERLAPDAITLPEVLRGAGYATGIFGKWHLGDEAAYQPGRRGFQEVFIHGAGGIGQSYPGSCGDAPGNTYFDPLILHNGAFEKTRGYCTDVFFEQALAWIAQVKDHGPFYCHLATNAPHAPLQVRPEDAARYAGKVPPDTAKFFGMIANFDDNVGRLLARLDALGLAKNTLVVMMTDNGGTGGVKVWNAGMRGAKNSPWLGGTRAASFWRWPGVFAPGDRAPLTAHVDFFPTLAELAGAELGEKERAQIEGRSLVPLLRDPAAAWPERTLFTHTGRWPRGQVDGAKYRGCSVRTPRWHLVNTDPKGEKAWQLFDVQADPGEARDLAAMQPEIVRELDTAYDAWWASVPPQLVNENAAPPKENAFATLYREQFKTTPARPNILFLFSDDQRADTIGNPHVPTPNLDRLAAQGTTMTRAYCMGAMQGAVCVPSRAMLMTGRTLFRVKENMAAQPTWPEQFARAGYATFITGKWHNGEASLTRSFAEGKAVFLGGMSQQTPQTAPVQDFGADGLLVNKRPAGKLPSELFADCAVEFLARQKGAAKPFLCYVPFNLPHDPRIAPPEFHERANADPPPLPANFLPLHHFNNGALTIRDEQLAPWPRTEAVVRQHLADYSAAIAFVDAQVGRILDALHASGHEDDTIIVFASDHGLAIGSHGLMGKQNLYEHSMSAPLIFAGPGIPPNARRDALCYLLDIFPTLGALAGIPAPEGSEGVNLAPVLAGDVARVRDSIFTAYTNTQRALRDERWKAIVYPQVNKTQLFDLQNDPHEIHDLAADPAHAGELARLTALLREAQSASGDTQPLHREKPLPLDFDFSAVKRAAAPDGK